MKVLVFCAHADDEVIAIGGTIRKMANAGVNIRLVMFSEGAEGYPTREEKNSIVAQREEETKEVCKILGIKEYFNLHRLDWSMKVDNQGYREVIHHIRSFQPEMIFTHSFADYNDHQAVHGNTTEGWFHASLACAIEDEPLSKLVPLYEYEVLQPLAKPGIIVDITDTFQAKVDAMNCYCSQHQLVGSVAQLMEGRALERGYFIGVKYGEALNRSRYKPRAVTDINKLLD